MNPTNYNPVRWLLDRLFELIMSLAALGLGIHLMLYPKAIQHSSFRYLQEATPAPWPTAIFMITATLGIVALVANSRWRYGALIRAGAAMVRALMWLQLGIALLKLAPQVGTPSPGLPVYLALTLGELMAMFMAATDDRSARHR